MDTAKQGRFLIGFLYFAVILGLAVLFTRVVIPAMLPFFIAFLVALILKHPIRFFRRKLHVQKNIAGIVFVVLFYGVIALLLTLLGVKLVAAVKNFALRLPLTYMVKIKPTLTVLAEWIESFAERLNPDTAAAFESAVVTLSSRLESSIASLATRAISSVGSFALGLPSLFINTLIAIVATVFLAIDWDNVFRFLLHQIPERPRQLINEIKTHLGRTLSRYIRSYALILFISFCELSIGFLILKQGNPFRLAAIIACFDILPVVASGTVLVPWSIISLLTGDYLLAIGLFCLYLVMMVIRQIMEPKIVGTSVGLHPLVTLLAMVVGTYVFGPIGLLGLPVTCALIHSLNADGIIHLYTLPKPAEKPVPGKAPAAQVPVAEETSSAQAPAADAKTAEDAPDADASNTVS